MSDDARATRRLRAMLPLAVCSLPLLVLLVVTVVRWIA